MFKREIVTLVAAARGILRGRSTASLAELGLHFDLHFRSGSELLGPRAWLQSLESLEGHDAQLSFETNRLLPFGSEAIRIALSLNEREVSAWESSVWSKPDRWTLVLEMSECGPKADEGSIESSVKRLRSAVVASRAISTDRPYYDELFAQIVRVLDGIEATAAPLIVGLGPDGQTLASALDLVKIGGMGGWLDSEYGLNFKVAGELVDSFLQGWEACANQSWN